jgi:hypothetical protein
VSALRGGTLTLSGSWQRLSTTDTNGYRELTIRSASSNSAVTLGKASNEPVGFLLAEEWKLLRGVSPHEVWVQGTAGNTLYWDGQGQA